MKKHGSHFVLVFMSHGQTSESVNSGTVDKIITYEAICRGVLPNRALPTVMYPPSEVCGMLPRGTTFTILFGPRSDQFSLLVPSWISRCHSSIGGISYLRCHAIPETDNSAYFF